MATDINKVIMIGRLTRDCGQQDFSYTQNGTARAAISIAVNRSKKQGDQWVEETSFFDIMIWGKTAENLHPYLRKGKQIGITGFLKQERWEKDGQKHSRVSIVAEDVQLLGGKTTESSSSKPPESQPAETGDEFPEDIPF